MEVAVGLAGRIIAYHNVNTLNINTTTKYVGCNQDTLFEALERLVPVDSVIE